MTDGTNPSAEPPEQDGNAPLPRRRFLSWGATVLAACALPVASCAPDRITRASPMGGPERRLSPTESEAISESALAKPSANTLAAYSAYPTAAYAPPGFLLLLEEDDRPDGFIGARAQIAQIYRPPKTSRPDPNMHYALMIFSTADAVTTLGGTGGAEGVKYPFRFADGSQSEATYHNGMWQCVTKTDDNGVRVKMPREWSNALYHSLTFAFGGYQVGIRGPVKAKVDFDELIKIASSMTLRT